MLLLGFHPDTRDAVAGQPGKQLTMPIGSVDEVELVFRSKSATSRRDLPQSIPAVTAMLDILGSFLVVRAQTQATVRTPRKGGRPSSPTVSKPRGERGRDSWGGPALSPHPL